MILVENSNSSRNVSINTTTQDSYKESEEVSTVRQLENINKSRVLNFVFRQLLQEYVSITYLHDIKLVFSNGHPESMEVCSIEQIDEFLDIWMTPEGAIRAKDMILKDYFKVENLNGEMKEFLIAKSVTNYDGSSRSYYTKSRQGDVYTRNTGGAALPPFKGMSIRVSGPILAVDVNILRTDSVVADALLGKGEALDCFNAQLQEAAVANALLQNTKLDQSIDLDKLQAENASERDKQVRQLIEKLLQGGDNEALAKAYARVAHGCCEVPQSGCGCHDAAPK